jgi:type III secretion protein F
MATTTTNYLDSLIGSVAQPGTGTPAFPIQSYNVVDGFDLVWSQKYLQDAMTKTQQQIAQVEQNTNLSDVERMFSMQMLMNVWSAISNLRTSTLKAVADLLKSVVRNIN